MAAVSLNLIMGFGGMVSFGHAAYLGIGGYVVGILAKEGINSGFVQWPVALVASGAVRARRSARCRLRTRGVYFIMITLAFAQMVYYVAIGLDRYGGDDGLTIYKRSQFGGLINLVEQDACSTISASRCCSACVYPGVAAGQFALRHGDPGRALERAAHARHRLSDLPLQARLLRHLRRDVRPRRRAARQPHRFHQPGDHALDALRRSHRHGGARRHGHGVRPGDRRGRVAGAGGGAARRRSTEYRRQDASLGILAALSAAAAGRAVRARRHRRHC